MSLKEELYNKRVGWHIASMVIESASDGVSEALFT
jgi:hypothetical protein